VFQDNRSKKRKMKSKVKKGEQRTGWVGFFPNRPCQKNSELSVKDQEAENVSCCGSASCGNFSDRALSKKKRGPRKESSMGDGVARSKKQPYFGPK